MEYKRILVTGANGFLGRHLMTMLSNVEGDHELIVPNIPLVVLDLRIKGHVHKIIDDFQPDIIFHLAANVGGIGYNLSNPVDVFQDNVLMNTYLISQAATLGVKKFVFVSSVCAYPKYVDIPTKESELWKGYPEESNAPYGIAKRVALAQLEACNKEYGMQFEYPILTNLYGPGDNFSESGHVIAALVKKFSEASQRRYDAEEVIIWGDGTPTRDFLYVKDAARALTYFLDKDIGRPVNISTGEEVSIAKICDHLAELTEFSGMVKCDTSKPNGQQRRCFDNSRARTYLNWEPRVLIKEGLLRTLEWYED